MGIGCVATSHYLIVDIDFWPSIELLPLLRGRLNDWDANAPPLALVVPNFQRSGHGCRNSEESSACRTAFINGTISMPQTLDELHGCLRSNNCVVFDGEYNPQGQASTDVRAWKAMKPGSVRRIPCITSDRYEPFVALRKSSLTPLFDERFVGYGKNKVELLVHLRRSGHAFEVLGGGFVLHFPHMPSTAKHHWLHSSAHQKVDQLFTRFTRELMQKYGGTSPRTPLCSDRGGGNRSSTNRRGMLINARQLASSRSDDDAGDEVDLLPTIGDGGGGGGGGESHAVSSSKSNTTHNRGRRGHARTRNKAPR